MLPTEDLFVHVCVLVHDLILSGAIRIPRRPGPAPACTDAELLAIAEVRHLLGRRSESGFLAEVARDWGHLFPGCRARARPTGRPAGCGGRSSRSGPSWPPGCPRMTASRPVPPRFRWNTRPGSAERTIGPAPATTLAAQFGRDAAHAEWFYGFRLAVKTDLGRRIVRAWSIVPAAVSERDVAGDLLEAGPAPRDLLADKGFSGRGYAAAQAARGTAVLVPPDKGQRAAMPSILRKVIAEMANRIETTFSEITVQMELARHGAHTFWGLPTRTAAIIAAHTLLRVCLTHD